jgi:hypothetical protein
MGQRQGVTDSGGGFADFFRGQREKDETEKNKNDLEDLGGKLDNSYVKNLIEGILKNSDSVSKEEMHIDKNIQNDIKGMTDDWEKDAEDTYKNYIKAGSAILGAMAGDVDVAYTGKHFTPEKGAGLLDLVLFLFGDVVPEGPIVSEGDYVVYRTEYSESYGLFGTTYMGGMRRHSVLIFSEVNNSGNPINHGYVFDLYTTEPHDNSMGGMPSPEGLPTTVPYYYEY